MKCLNSLQKKGKQEKVDLELGCFEKVKGFLKHLKTTTTGVVVRKGCQMSRSTDEATEVKEEEEEQPVEDKQLDKTLEEEEEFILVKGRGRRQRTKKNSKLTASFNHDHLSWSSNNFEERQVTETKEQVLKKIINCVAHLRDSQYYTKFLEKISIENLATFTDDSQFSSIYCLGLGPFSSHLLSRIARYQLALLILLQEKYQVPVELYDPVFSDQEKIILSQEFQFTVSPTNEQGHHLITSPTLLFLPHCPHQLLNNLLYTNWSPDNLPHLILISNTVSSLNLPSITTNDTDTTTSSDLYYLSKISKISTEIPLPNIFTDDPSIFNDLSLHIFPPSKIFSTKLEESFWLDKPFPTYDSPDFISTTGK